MTQSENPQNIRIQNVKLFGSSPIPSLKTELIHTYVLLKMLCSKLRLVFKLCFSFEMLVSFLMSSSVMQAMDLACSSKICSQR